ncbi:M20/M25/M40 family metallo-hydrolase [Sutterella sp.]|uniref:M20/M25/M40 family metallo-hydrolase n=1 Tax=Sutterella sp. TaxID=1981025 RepID=UPI0026DF0302|nr:M20/M25/M40 family metallo-hydrolase [Sutterella sp.]MDO5532194.1 M20/M25/M40 family metallo-hydrolase [Sutterella sp.]
MSDLIPVCREDCLAAVKALLGNDAVRAAVAQAEREQETRVAQQCELTEIPSPPFHEKERPIRFAEMLTEIGIPDVRIDETGNVIGRLKGRGDGPVLVIAAHTDTVFPEGTPIKVRREGNMIYAPGISDDAGGLAAVLQVARSIVTQKLLLIGDIVFVGTVGEEGNGDLRGSKALWAAPNDYDAFIAIDSAATTRILKGSVGCKRYRVKFSGPGGHSLHKFGISGSAIHVLCRAGYKIDQIEVPAEPRCTFNIGVIRGGTSVNAIAADAEFELDIRSLNQEGLEAFTAKLLPLIDEAVAEENAHWKLEGENAVKAEIIQIGDRPAGVNKPDSPVVHAAYAAMQSLGIPLEKFSFAATDQNVPLAMGYPATTLGAGGAEWFNHSVKEHWDATDAFKGPQLAMLTALALVGVEGVTEPVLEKSH